jgi:hypothetical protein
MSRLHDSYKFVKKTRRQEDEKIRRREGKKTRRQEECRTELVRAMPSAAEKAL